MSRMQRELSPLYSCTSLPCCYASALPWCDVCVAGFNYSYLCSRQLAVSLNYGKLNSSFLFANLGYLFFFCCVPNGHVKDITLTVELCADHSRKACTHSKMSSFNFFSNWGLFAWISCHSIPYSAILTRSVISELIAENPPTVLFLYFWKLTFLCILRPSLSLTTFHTFYAEYR